MTFLISGLLVLMALLLLWVSLFVAAGKADEAVDRQNHRVRF